MRHPEKVPAFVKRDALNIVRGLQTTAIGIPWLSGVKHDVRFGHRRSGIAVIGDRQGTRPKGVTKKSTAKGHRIDAVARDDRRGRIHHPIHLQASHHLVPQIQRR